jgi:TRAP-type C4-dicarboxylate transport system substrate-binding protein
MDGPIGQDMLKKMQAKGLIGLAWTRERLPPHDQQQAAINRPPTPRA